MADLQVSSGVLDELIAGFTGFGSHLARACSQISAGDSALTGDDPLAGQIRDFASSWNYGLKQLGQHSADCVKLLRQVGTSFEKLDQQLAGKLRHQ